MSFHYSAYTYNTTHRPRTYYSHLNEDAYCDNEVNLILEKNRNQHSIEQSSETLGSKEQPSVVVVPQTNPYYFMPIREQTSATALAAAHTVTDSSLLPLSSDLHHPSTLNLFDESSSNYFPSTTSILNSSDTTTVNQFDQTTYTLSDADLAALFVSSLMTTTPSPSSATSTTLMDRLANSNDTSATPYDDVFLHHLADLACDSTSSLIDSQASVGPPPGFENFRFDSSSASDLLLSPSTNNPNMPSMNSAASETPVSSSDTINFSQLLQSASVDLSQQQAPIGGHVGAIRSSSSSHSSFTSDEQSIFFPMSTHPYSSTTSSSILHASSQIFSTASPPSASTTSTATNPLAKPHIPNSLSLNNNHNQHHHYYQPQLSSSSSSSVSRVAHSNAASPLPKNSFEAEPRRTDGDMTPNHIFASQNSFFSNGHSDFGPSSKQQTGKALSMHYQSAVVARTSSSSASSSTSSSIDDALIQLTQQQQQQKLTNMNKLFNDEPSSIFHFASHPSNNNNNNNNIDRQQQAVHDNISFLASMATASTPTTPESPWQSSNALHPASTTPLDPHNGMQRKMSSSMMLRKQQQQQQHMGSPQAGLTVKSNGPSIHEFTQNLNELCYKGFDELNALIQEQRWVQNYVNLNSNSVPSPTSPTFTFNGSNSCSAHVLIVPEYFIFKCKKVETTASHVYELLDLARPDLRLREMMKNFKSWQEAIFTAEAIHQEEETKLRLSIEHPHSYYMTEPVLLAAFERVASAVGHLGNMTQQVRVAFQYATLNVFQSLSRQQTSQSSSNIHSSSSNAIALAPFQAGQQPKSSSMHRPATGSLRTTP